MLITEWPEFRELDLQRVRERMTGRVIVDGRNFMDSDTIRNAGFVYEGIGRGPAIGIAGANPLRRTRRSTPPAQLKQVA